MKTLVILSILSILAYLAVGKVNITSTGMQSVESRLQRDLAHP